MRIFNAALAALQYAEPARALGLLALRRLIFLAGGG